MTAVTGDDRNDLGVPVCVYGLSLRVARGFIVFEVSSAFDLIRLWHPTRLLGLRSFFAYDVNSFDGLSSKYHYSLCLGPRSQRRSKRGLEPSSPVLRQNY